MERTHTADFSPEMSVLPPPPLPLMSSILTHLPYRVPCVCVSVCLCVRASICVFVLTLTLLTLAWDEAARWRPQQQESPAGQALQAAAGLFRRSPALPSDPGGPHQQLSSSDCLRAGFMDLHSEMGFQRISVFVFVRLCVCVCVYVCV